ncbi:hypothetical protein SODALDRAFT_329729 [Sodiomyces alkalinus F11]|uniref:Uncharacterized protein n=1 Tax=Sodiomyces alkalinus (strain CBS 110278 / VKM F-3762 / F11) TaxID=1314773 RepID=A0A3N2PJI7_SODAK|nr:hypothetical protein SODALDRAFT_329729 [Sodiomyces alkalinus F11]ROT34476.1 hypothetical protein SODALDRAFT_329729 [Sodiomyces alkalinus F11]
MRLALFASLASTAFACSPMYNPDYYGNFRPPVACWHGQDTMCRPYIRAGTQQLLLPDENVVVVVPLSETCIATIAEEHAREQDGRLTYGWTQQHGNLHVVGNTLVITEANMPFYQALVYL